LLTCRSAKNTDGLSLYGNSKFQTNQEGWVIITYASGFWRCSIRRMSAMRTF